MTTALLDALLLVLRTVPIYPADHQRVRSSLNRLHALLQGAATTGESLFVEVVPKGLRFQDEALDMRGAGREELRNALVATAVADLAIWAEASDESLMEFAVRLNQNVRRAAATHLSFADLWGENIEGVWLGEQLYDEPWLSDPDHALSGEGQASGEGGGGDAAARAQQFPLGSLKRLRRLTLGCPRTRKLLRQVAEIVKAKSGASGAEETDLLDHILALLPAEARRFPLQGLRAVERTLEAFLAEMQSIPSDGSPPDSDAVLAHTVAHLFPSAASKAPVTTVAEPVDSGLPPTPLMLQRERERLLGEDVDLLVREAAADVSGPLPLYVDTTGRGEYGWVLLDAYTTGSPDRREPIRRRLVAHLKSRKEREDVVEILTRLKVLCGPGSTEKDSEAARGLASILWEAELDDLGADALDLEPAVAARTFPHLFRAYLAIRGAKAGPVCHITGRDTILKDGPSLVAPRGALHGPGVDRVLSERGTDVLPLWEVLLRHGSPDERRRTAQALKGLSLPLDAMVVLKAAPLDRVPVDLLCGLCEDGFLKEDSHRWDRAAVGVLQSVIDSPPPGSDAGTVPYAITALRYFGTDLVAPLCARLLARKGILHAYSRDVRQFAKAVLAHRREVDTAPPGTRPEFRT